MIKHITLAGAFLILAISTILFAGTYYVSTTGNDANDGSISAPWRSVYQAVHVAHGGDIVYLRGGTYTESEVWIRQDEGLGGSNGKYLTISAYPDETPIFTNSDRPFLIDADYVRVLGLDFRNGKEMAIVGWHGIRHHCELINNRFSGTASWAPIEASGDSLLIQGNTIKLEGNTVGTQGHGIYLSRGSHNILRGNTISGMVGYGIHIFDQRRSEDPANVEILFNDILVEGNTIFNSIERAGIIVATDEPAKMKGIVIRNNILYKHAGSGIVIENDLTDVKIYNNTIYSVNTDGIDWNGAEGILISANERGDAPTNIEVKNNIIYTVASSSTHIATYGAKNITVSNNLYWPSPANLLNVDDPHAIKADPKFVDPNGADFRLKEGSPAIAAGVDVGLPFSGAAPDLGALAYGSGVTVGTMSLEGNYSEGSIRLHWNAASGKTIAGFEIERSINGIDFIKIGLIRCDTSILSQQIFQFEDPISEAQGKYYYRLKIIDLAGSFVYTDPVTVMVVNPEGFELRQNYPNPFVSATEIVYAVPKSSPITLAIFNMAGQEVARLVDRVESRGLYRTEWNGLDSTGQHLASGLYICQLTSSNATSSLKIVLLH
jgi:parallel beta-helix repeat protein